jgi:phosphotransferase family enzyme
MTPDYGDTLRSTLGTPTWRHRLDSSPRSLVWLADIAGSPVVVKQVTGGADADARFGREVTALRLAARAAVPVAPELLGVDGGRRVLVLEHLAGGPLPADWPVRWAAALARLHATTTAADAGALPRWAPPGPGDAAAFAGFAAALGVPVPAGVADEIDALLRRLAEPSGFALLHGDPCPGNDFYATGARFVDLEQASLGAGATELAYLRIGFPTCWCVTAPDADVIADAERAYRDAGGATGSLADACAGWLVRGDALVQKAHRDSGDHLAAAVAADWAWGTATARQRLLHRLGVVAGFADALPGLATLCTRLHQQMTNRWPALYPLPTDRATAKIIQ